MWQSDRHSKQVVMYGVQFVMILACAFTAMLAQPVRAQSPTKIHFDNKECIITFGINKVRRRIRSVMTDGDVYVGKYSSLKKLLKAVHAHPSTIDIISNLLDRYLMGEIDDPVLNQTITTVVTDPKASNILYCLMSAECSFSKMDSERFTGIYETAAKALLAGKFTQAPIYSDLFRKRMSEYKAESMKKSNNPLKNRRPFVDDNIDFIEFIQKLRNKKTLEIHPRIDKYRLPYYILIQPSSLPNDYILVKQLMHELTHVADAIFIDRWMQYNIDRVTVGKEPDEVFKKFAVNIRDKWYVSKEFYFLYSETRAYYLSQIGLDQIWQPSKPLDIKEISTKLALKLVFIADHDGINLDDLLSDLSKITGNGLVYRIRNLPMDDIQKHMIYED